MTLRALIRAPLPALALIAAMHAASAQQYPARPLHVIIPAGPGGAVDTIARVIGQPLGVALAQPVVMDNKPGAGTMLAWVVRIYPKLFSESADLVIGMLQKLLAH